MKSIATAALEFFGLQISRKRDVAIPSEKRFQNLLDELSVDLVLDVGANVGQFAKSLRQYYSGTIYSFEPVPHLYEEASDASQGDAQWFVFPVGLGDKTETLEINIYRGTQLGSLYELNSFSREFLGSRVDRLGSQEVQIYRFDEFAPNLPVDPSNATVLLKSDTQGHEIAVFDGMGDYLRYVKAMLVELSVIPIYKNTPSWIEAISSFQSAGFSIVDLSPVSRENGKVVEFDCLMKR